MPHLACNGNVLAKRESTTFSRIAERTYVRVMDALADASASLQGRDDTDLPDNLVR